MGVPLRHIIGPGAMVLPALIPLMLLAAEAAAGPPSDAAPGRLLLEAVPFPLAAVRLAPGSRLRTQADAFEGWIEELAYLRSAYGRAQVAPMLSSISRVVHSMYFRARDGGKLPRQASRCPR